MRVNGDPYPHRQGLTLHQLLADLKVEQGRVVVMHDDAIYRAGKIPDVPPGSRMELLLQDVCNT